MYRRYRRPRQEAFIFSLREHFPEKWTPISGLPEIGSQCRPSRLQPTPISGLPEIGSQYRPSRLQPTWVVVFRRKCDQLKKLERVSDSIKSKRALECVIAHFLARLEIHGAASHVTSCRDA